ncbi:MAG: copper transport protein [Actinomycetota bacterium]|nr:copper transport protein [Actinomycetota bacterium]
MRTVRSVVFGATAIAFVLLTAAPAFAHATFEGSTPSAGSQVSVSPKAIVLRFSEAVTVDRGAIRIVRAPKGDTVSIGKYGRENGDSATVSVPLPNLQKGVYAVVWRVISDDSHPVQGTFTFGVGNVTLNSKSADFAQQQLSKAGGGSDVVGATYAVVRFLAFAALAIVVGVSAFVVATGPEGWGSPRVRRIVWFGWGVAFATTFAGIGLQGAYGSGGGLGSVVKPSVIGDVLDTRFGKAWLARGILLLLAVPVLRGLQRSRNRAGVLPLAGAAIGVAIMFTPGLAGHASTGRWIGFAIPVDALHLLAMSVWFGGLLILAVEVLRSDDVDAIEPMLDLFSRMAMVAVGVIIATGAFQSVRQVEHWNDLLNTGYGRLLLVKLGAFAAVLVVASASRDIVRFEVRRGARAQLPSPLPVGPGAMRAAPELPDPADTVRRLRSAVWYEIGFAITVLAVTALLVNAAPIRGGSAKPYLATLTTENPNVQYDVEVTPARVGPNQLHLTAQKPTGEEIALVGITVTIANPDKGIAPITVKLLRLGTGGHYAGTGLSIPFAGKWRIDIRGLVTDVDEAAAAGEFKVSS